MLRIAICDDDEQQIKITRWAVAQTIGSRAPEIDLFSDGEELKTAVEQGDYRPDIALLDIQMPGLGGIETAKFLNDCVPACRIIFLTSFLGYATDVYAVRHSYFVLKSELSQRIAPALSRAMEDMGEDMRLSFRADGEIHTVEAGEVLYLERNLRKTRVVCLREEYITGGHADELLASAPEGQFVHCHQSYWVNLQHVTAMGTDSFTLTGGQEVPISRSCRSAAKEAFFAWLHKST